MTKNKTIGVVILNYATFPETIALVEALQSQSTAQTLRIVIVDNASPNESYNQLKPLRERFENVVAVLQTGKNLGYAKGNNFGLKHLEENNAPDYVAILNNDVILPNDCFERLIKRYEVLENPAIIAPMMVDIDGNRQFMGNLGSTWQDFKILFSLYTKLSKPTVSTEVDNTGQQAMRVDVIGGSFMFARFDTFKEMGYFYPNTFLYVEERFVAEAAKRLGYNNYVLLDQTYIHAHNSPTISSYHGQISKYKMLYKSRLEYIKVCKKHGRIKAAIFKPFMQWSLFEWRVIGWVKSKIGR
ncbi:MAG: glycosyltransferase family 2 protein [Rikenellaceae bacterium]